MLVQLRQGASIGGHGEPVGVGYRQIPASSRAAAAFSAMAVSSGASVPALSARKGRPSSSAGVSKMALAIGLRQVLVVQTKRTFFTRSRLRGITSIGAIRTASVPFSVDYALTDCQAQLAKTQSSAFGSIPRACASLRMVRKWGSTWLCSIRIIVLTPAPDFSARSCWVKSSRVRASFSTGLGFRGHGQRFLRELICPHGHQKGRSDGGAQPVKYVTEVDGARRCPGASTVLMTRRFRWPTDHVVAAIPALLLSESAKKAKGLPET
jgi:hypothetical protein